MAQDPRLDVPEGAQVNQEEWDQFIDFAGKTHIRGAVRVLSKLPSTPRCDPCDRPSWAWTPGPKRRTTGCASA